MVAKKKNKKKAAKIKAQQTRRYEAALPSRYHKRPTSGDVAADTDVIQAGSTLRGYARELCQNDDLVKGGLNILVDKVIGQELIPEPLIVSTTGRPMKRLNKQVTDLWWEFSLKPEITGELCMAELQQLAASSWLRDGEVLARHIRGSLATSVNGLGYALQMLEADMLPFQYSDNEPQLNGNFITMGIERNQLGQPVRYHIYRYHPSAYYYGSNEALIPVDAADMIHLKFTDRLNMTRGVTIFAPVLNRMNGVKGYEKSELVAAQVNAAMCAAITKSPDLATPTVTTEQNGEESAIDIRDMTMEPGVIFDDLAPGEDITMISPDRPNAELINFRNAQLKAMASGIGVAYSSLSKSYDGSYSAMRQEMVDSKIRYDVLRRQFINDFMNVVYREFIGMLGASRVLIPKTVDLKSLYSPRWSEPATPWIDPLKEIQAATIAIEQRLDTRENIIRNRGGNPQQIDQEIQNKEDSENDDSDDKPDLELVSNEQQG
jgi:lambda family phage portal protein